MIKIRLSKEDLLTKEQVKHLILTNNSAAMRAAIVIYQQQEIDEQDACLSLHEDNKGFNRFDAYELSQFAISCIKNNGAYIKDINKYRWRLVKYSQQIADIANSKKNIQFEWSI